MDVLDLDPGVGAVGAGQQEVDAAAGAVAHLGADRGVAGEGRDAAPGEGLGDEAVGEARVDAGEAAAGELDEAPG